MQDSDEDESDSEDQISERSEVAASVPSQQQKRRDYVTVIQIQAITKHFNI